MSSAMERAKEKLARLKKKTTKGGGGSDFMAKFEEGRTILRIAPPWNKEEGDYELELAYHKNIKQPGEKKPKDILCPKSVDSKLRCPFCEESERLREKARSFPRKSSKNKHYWQLGSAMAAKPKYFSNAIQLTKEGPVTSTDNKPKPATKFEILGYGVTISKGILGYYTDEDADTGGPWWKEGSVYDFIIDRTGTEFDDTEYSVKVTRKYAEVDTSELEKDLTDLQDLLAKPKSYKELVKIMKGEESEESEEEEDDEEAEEVEVDDDEDEKPAKKKSKPADDDEDQEDDEEEEAPKKKVKPKADEDEDEEEPEEEDDDEEEKKPAKKGSKTSDDDDSDDDQESDDDEEAKPAPKKGKKPKCFGQSDDYNAEDEMCQDCDYQIECLKQQKVTAKEEGNKKLLKVIDNRLAELEGDEEGEPEEDEEEEKPAKKKKAKGTFEDEDDEEAEVKAKKKLKVKDDDDEEIEDEDADEDVKRTRKQDEDEDEEEVKPKKKAKAVEEEDEEEEIDEEEIEKKMRAKLKGKK